jgi:hypothetical protein
MKRQLVFLMVVLFSGQLCKAQHISATDSSTLFKENLLGITKHPMAQLLGLPKADPGAVSWLTKNGYREMYNTFYKIDTGNLNAALNANVFINSEKNPNPFYYSASWHTTLTDTNKILSPTISIPLNLKWNISKTAIEKLIGKPNYTNPGLPGYIHMAYVIPYKNDTDSVYQLVFTLKHPLTDTTDNVTCLKGLRVELFTRTKFNEWVDGRNYYKKYGKEKPKPLVAKNKTEPITTSTTNNPPPKTVTNNSRMTPSQYAHIYKDLIVKEGGVSSPAVYAGSSDYTRPLRTFAACARNGYTAYIHLFIADNLQITSSRIERTCGDYDKVNLGSFALVQTVNGVKVYAAKLYTPSNAPRCQCNYTIIAQGNAQSSADMPMFVYYK